LQYADVIPILIFTFCQFSIMILPPWL